MKKSKHLLIQAYTHLIIGLIILGLLFTYKPEIYFIIFGFVYIIYSAYKSFSLFQEIKKVDKEEIIIIDPVANAEPHEKIRYYKRTLYFGVPAFIVLSAWIAYDLNSLESLEVQSVRIWGPIALLYEFCGYWPAVLSVPLVGVFSITALLRKVYYLQKENPS